jgi:hypothetical protein
MKCFAGMIYCLVLSAAALCGQERISVLNGQCTVVIPEGVIRFKPYPPYPGFASVADAEKYHEDKISVSVVATEGGSIDRYSWRLSAEMKNLVEKRTVTEKDFLGLLNARKSKPVFTSAGGPYNITESQAFVKYRGILIGELYGYDGSEDVVAPAFHGYSMDLVVGDAIVTITIRLHDPKGRLVKQMSDYFYFETSSYQKYIWRTWSARGALYKRINAGDFKGLPVEFTRLRETLDYILSNIEIPRYGENHFYKTETALRLRAGADVHSGAIVTLEKDTPVEIIEEGPMQIIDDIAARWVRVRTLDGNQSGWCFSGYLGPH